MTVETRAAQTGRRQSSPGNAASGRPTNGSNTRRGREPRRQPSEASVERSNDSRGVAAPAQAPGHEMGWRTRKVPRNQNFSNQSGPTSGKRGAGDRWISRGCWIARGVQAPERISDASTASHRCWIASGSCVRGRCTSATRALADSASSSRDSSAVRGRGLWRSASGRC